jgi:hypothetical protein
MEYGVFNIETGECIFTATTKKDGRKPIAASTICKNWAVRKGLIKRERTKYFVNYIMDKYEIKPV